MLSFRRKFHPVIQLPGDYEVYDFTRGYDPERMLKSPYGIGKYNEKRKSMYDHELFAGGRDIHVGIDIAAPVGAPIFAFAEGTIWNFGNNPSPGDYGYTLVTKHEIEEQTFYALFGHLSKVSIQNKKIGQRFSAGEQLASIGDKSENGGWNPHLHFQLSLQAPGKPDMPGVVSDADRAEALKLYPDPRIILGPLY